MKKLLSAITAVLLFLLPNVNYGQAPILGTAANFVLFSSVGAVTNTGTSQITGNVGTNSGSSTGFGNVNGQMHDNDGTTGTCAADLLTLYTQIDTATPDFFISTTMGNGDTLIPGVYFVSAAATLANNLILDAQGDPNAVFIFQVQGALSVSSLTKVKMINGAQACNIFWKVEGLISIATGTVMRGTMVSHNAAIAMNALDTLEGRALAINGAVTLDGMLAYTPLGCGAAILTGPAAPNLLSTKYYAIFSSNGYVSNTAGDSIHVVGDVGTNVGLTTGFDSAEVTGIIHPIPDASTATAASDLLLVYNYLDSLPYDIQLLYPAAFGHGLVLTPHTYLLGAATALTDSLYLNAEGNDTAVFVIKITGALSAAAFSRVILINGTQSKNVYWLVNGAVTLGDSSVFNGTIVAYGAILSDAGAHVNGRLLSESGAITTNSGMVIGFTTPTAGSVTGNSTVCVGSSITLSDSGSSSPGIWSASNAKATVSNIGVVTGVTPGIDTIKYTVVDSFGTTVTTTIITINASPNAGTITGGNTACMGSTLILNDAAIGGSWSSSNTRATVSGGTVTPVSTGIDTVRYIVTTSCGSDTAIKIITISTVPNAGTITGANTVCMGSTLSLTDLTTGGAWSSSNTRATVSGGTVTPVSPGTDTIRYIATTACGSDTALHIIVINPLPVAGTITGPSYVCLGYTATLTDLTPLGVWSASNTRASVDSGVVTGNTLGLDTIRYISTTACGTDSATAIISVNPLPYAGVITGASNVCVGSVVTFSDLVPSGAWSVSDTNASISSGGVVTGLVAGLDTVRYVDTNLCGTDISEKAITVNPLPDAGTITGFTSVCIGSSITLSDATTGGTWNSTNSNATVIGGIVRGDTAGADTIVYSFTNSCGIDTATHIIVVNPLPYAGTISGPASVCIGLSILLTADSAGGIWSTTNVTDTVTSGLFKGMTAGLDTVRYELTNFCGTDTATKIITIIPLPNAGVITGASSVCVGLMITLSDDSTGGVWNSNSFTDTINAGIVTGILPGTDTIKYSITNTCGTDTVTHIIAINPQPYAGIINGLSMVCVNSTITMTDVVAAGAWSMSNGSATISDSGVITGQIAGLDTIRYVDTNMCGTDIVQKAITVNPLPYAGVITGSNNVCLDLSITLTAAITGGVWISSNNTATVSGGIVHGVRTGIDTVMYLVTNVCGTDTATRTIVVNPLPDTPVITTSATSSICSGTSYQNFGTSIPPSAGNYYSWSAVNATISDISSNGQYSLISFPGPGIAIVILTSNVLLTSCVNKDSSTVDVSNSLAQNPTVIYFQSHFVCLPANLDSYQWGYDDVTTLDSTMLIGEINQDYLNTNPDYAHKYYWVMTTLNGCTQKTYLTVPLSIQNVNSDAVTMDVYPNPAKEFINVVINTTAGNELEMEVVNMAGQRLNTTQTLNHKATIDVAALPAGFYLINCYHDGNRITSARFIKN